MSTFRVPLRRNRYFRDVDGIDATSKRTAEVLSETIDWTDRLDGETISGATWTSRGATISGESYTDTTTSATITGVGEVVIQVSTSGGRTLEMMLRYYGIDTRSQDYVTPDRWG